MIQQQAYSFLVQAEDGQLVEQGIHEAGRYSVLIDVSLGLAAIGYGLSDFANSKQVLEILADDMQLNMSTSDKSIGKKDSALAASCLQESYENIDEFLKGTYGRSGDPDHQMAVALTALQLLPGSSVCSVAGEFCCLKFSHDKIHTLNDIYDAQSTSSTALGYDKSLSLKMVQSELAPGDVMVLTTLKVVQTVGEEHIRLTLSRFGDNLDMALKQINTRAAHRGLDAKPTLILAQINFSIKPQTGWFGRARNL